MSLALLYYIGMVVIVLFRVGLVADEGVRTGCGGKDIHTTLCALHALHAWFLYRNFALDVTTVKCKMLDRALSLLRD